MNRQHKRLAGFLAIYAAFLTFIGLTYRDFGISWDESFYVDSGRLFVTNFFDMDLIVNSIEDFHVKGHGLVVDGIYFFLLDLFDTAGSFEGLHLLKALASSLVLIVVYLMICRLQPQGFTPLAGVALLIFFPRWLGDAFDNHMDGSATLLYALQMLTAIPLLAFPRSTETSSKQLAVRGIVFGALCAISFSHRVILAAVPAACFLLLLLQLRTRAELARLARLAGIFGVAFYASLVIVDPYIRVHWLLGAWDKVTEAVNVGDFGNIRVLFDGQIFYSDALPRSYLPKWMMISIPCMTLVLLGTGIARLGCCVCRPSGGLRRSEAAFLLLCLFLPILAAVAMRPVIFDGWRHFLFLTVPVVVIASLGLRWGLGLLSPPLARVGVAVFLLGLIQIGISMWRLHPYQYVFFNQTVGGLRGAEGRYELDYWGKSYKEAAKWLNADLAGQPGAPHSVQVCGPVEAASNYFSEAVRTVSASEEAEYVICFVRADFQKIPPTANFYHPIERDGVALTWIWRVPDASAR